MRLYFAGLHIGWKEVWGFEVPKRILLSYHYHTDLMKTIQHCKKNNLCDNVELILDSGAFSSWNKGIHVNLQMYADCIKKINS